MRCPNCKSVQTQVLDSRVRVHTDEVYRRRECLDCQTRWKTLEVYAEELERLQAVDGNNQELCGLAVHLYETYGPEAQPQFADTKFMIRPDRRRAA